MVAVRERVDPQARRLAERAGRTLDRAIDATTRASSWLDVSHRRSSKLVKGFADWRAAYWTKKAEGHKATGKVQIADLRREEPFANRREEIALLREFATIMDQKIFWINMSRKRWWKPEFVREFAFRRSKKLSGQVEETIAQRREVSRRIHRPAMAT